MQVCTHTHTNQKKTPKSLTGSSFSRQVGYLTEVPHLIVTQLLEGACGKMIQAPWCWTRGFMTSADWQSTGRTWSQREDARRSRATLPLANQNVSRPALARKRDPLLGGPESEGSMAEVHVKCWNWCCRSVRWVNVCKIRRLLALGMAI